MVLPFESEFSAVFVTQRYCVHKIPALVHILNNMNLDCAIPSCFWKYIVILSSSIHQGYCKWFLSFRFLHRNLVSRSLLSQMYHMIHASLSSLYHRPCNFGKDFILWYSALCSFSIIFLLSVSQMQISSWAPCFHIHLCLSFTQIFTSSSCGKTIFPSRSRQSVSLVVVSKKKCAETEHWYQPHFISCTYKSLLSQMLSNFHFCFIHWYIRMKLWCRNTSILLTCIILICFTVNFVSLHVILSNIQYTSSSFHLSGILLCYSLKCSQTIGHIIAGSKSNLVCRHNQRQCDKAPSVYVCVCVCICIHPSLLFPCWSAVLE